jgi:hypothetical protein
VFCSTVNILSLYYPIVKVTQRTLSVYFIFKLIENKLKGINQMIQIGYILDWWLNMVDVWVMGAFIGLAVMRICGGDVCRTWRAGSILSLCNLAIAASLGACAEQSGYIGRYAPVMYMDVGAWYAIIVAWMYLYSMFDQHVVRRTDGTKSCPLTCLAFNGRFGVLYFSPPVIASILMPQWVLMSAMKGIVLTRHFNHAYLYMRNFHIRLVPMNRV